MTRLPQPVRAIATRTWHATQEIEMTIFKYQPLLIVTIESDTWAKARNAAGEELYVPRIYLKFHGAVSSVSIGMSLVQAYRTWREQVDGVLKDARDLGKTKKELEADKKERPEAEAEEPGGGKGKVKMKTWVQFETFPFLPKDVCTCEQPQCVSRKSDTGLGACRHDVERLLRGGVEGAYSGKWLREESLKWHPDRWEKILEEDFRAEGKKMVTEMFVILKTLEQERTEAEGNLTK